MTAFEDLMNDPRTIELAIKFADAMDGDTSSDIAAAAIIRMLGGFSASITGNYLKASILVATMASAAIAHAEMCLENQREGSTLQ